ncbi:MAG: alanine/glycine:cation symporter family protein [Candidatus Cyclobacteriaceae bacterium M2_1C_046]
MLAVTLAEEYVIGFANWIWGTPLLILLLGGGLFFLLYSRFVPFKYFFHAINVLRGKYDKPEEKGEINHYKALATQLASTVGMGNISGVAVAIATGGPGAIFWMWVSAFVGIATKFFTCSLAIMYRGQDKYGNYHGGPMYVIREGLGKNWLPLSYLFCIAGLIGMLPIFQANQLTQVIRDILLLPNDIGTGHLSLMNYEILHADLFVGLGITALVSLVIFGGLTRVSSVAGRVVPVMVVIYFILVLSVLVLNITEVPGVFKMIFVDAFTGNAVLGGAVGAVIMTGARRAAFSNEAGIGTAPIAHGAAKTDEPIREGLVGMLGPAIDTLIICTLTAVTILITGVWQTSEANGVTLTANAFEKAFPGAGNYLLLLCIFFFAISSLFTYSWYGSRCVAFMFGEEKKNLYNYFYVATIIVGATSSLIGIISLIDAAFAVMAIPTMISALLLAPKVRVAAVEYFNRVKKEKWN